MNTVFTDRKLNGFRWNIWCSVFGHVSKKFKNSNKEYFLTQTHIFWTTLLCCFDSRWTSSAAHINVGLSICSRKKKIPKAKHSTFEEHIFHFGSRSHLHIVRVIYFVYKIEDSFPFLFSLSIASCRTYSYTIFLPSSVWSPAPNLLAILWWNGIHKRQIFRQELIWFSLHGNGCCSVVWCLVNATYAAVFFHRMGVLLFMYKSKPLVAKPSNTKQ